MEQGDGSEDGHEERGVERSRMKEKHWKDLTGADVTGADVSSRQKGLEELCRDHMCPGGSTEPMMITMRWNQGCQKEGCDTPMKKASVVK